MFRDIIIIQIVFIITHLSLSISVHVQDRGLGTTVVKPSGDR